MRGLLHAVVAEAQPLPAGSRGAGQQHFVPQQWQQQRIHPLGHQAQHGGQQIGVDRVAQAGADRGHALHLVRQQAQAFQQAGFAVITLSHPHTNESLWDTRSSSFSQNMAVALEAGQYPARVADCATRSAPSRTVSYSATCR